MAFSVTRLLRKVNVSEVAKDVKEIAVFINRELLPYLHELRESLKTAFETPSDSLDLIGDTEGDILIRGAAEWETTNLSTEMSQFASASILFDGDFKRAAVTGEVTIAENTNISSIDRATNFDWTGEHTLAERSAAPSVAAGQGAVWPADSAPTVLIFTDDIGQDWRTGYAALKVQTSSLTVTNDVTNLQIGGDDYTVPGGSSHVGSAWKWSGHYVFVHAAATTPTITYEVLVNAVVVSSFVFTPVNVAATYAGRVEAWLTIQTIGATGTAVASIRQDGNGANNTDQQGEGSINTATFVIDTTVDRVIEARIRMTTAVASNTLTLVQSFLERLA